MDLQSQLLTFLLELCGLSLAYIEVRSPTTAARVAHYLGKLASPIEELRNPSESDSDGDQLLDRSLGKLIRTVINIGSLPVLALFAFRLWQAFSADSLTVEWLIPQIISFLMLLLVVSLGLLALCLALYFAVVAGSDFATRFVEGRAVGTLGIMLAAVGLLLEFIQLVSAF